MNFETANPAATAFAAPQFIRSPNFDNLSLGPAPALSPIPTMTAAATAAQPVGSPSTSLAKTSKKASFTSIFKDPKKRMIVVAVVLLIGLGVALYLIHRSFKRRQRKIDEDEEAQEALAAGQHQRQLEAQQAAQQQQQMQQPPPQAGFTQGPPRVVPGSDYERQMASSLREDERRFQDMQFRQHQMQQMASASGQMPPEFQHTAPPPVSPPGMLPNLGVNPNASMVSSGGGGGSGGAPIPGSPDDMGYTPI